MKKKLISVLLLMCCILMTTGCGKEETKEKKDKDESYTKINPFNSSEDFYIGSSDVGYNTLDEAIEADLLIFKDEKWRELLDGLSSKNWDAVFNWDKSTWVEKWNIKNADELKKKINESEKVDISMADDCYDDIDLSSGRFDSKEIETHEMENYQLYQVTVYYDFKPGVEVDREFHENGLYGFYFDFVKLNDKYYPLLGYHQIQSILDHGRNFGF